MKTAFLSVMLLSLTLASITVVAQEKGALPLPDPGKDRKSVV